MTLELRPYQREAVDGVMRELGQCRATLLVLATGLGKTIVFAEVARRVVAGGRRVLVVAHRDELLEQARAKLVDAGVDDVEIEQGPRRASAAAMVVVASVQTLARARRREAFAVDAFALIVVDEAHHATATSYRALLEYFAPAGVLGVTATPQRGDGDPLRAIFESCAYRYDLRAAISDGWLAPIRAHRVETSLDFRGVRVRAGDLDAGGLEEVLTRAGALAQVVRPLVELAGDRRTLLFTPTIRVAHEAAVLLLEHGVRAEAVDGSTPASDRAAALARYTAGVTQVLANCALFTEGVDLPATECIAIARPTNSRALFAQMVGRGTRLAPGKHDVLVLDFCGVVGRVSLATIGDVLAGRELTPREIARLAQLAAREPGRAAHEHVAALEADVLAAARAARVRAEASAVDVFDAIGVELPAELAGPPATPKQLAAVRSILDGQAVDLATLDRQTASRIIGAACARREAGLATIRQALVLRRHGLRGDVPFELASAAITAIARSGWRVPAALAADPRFAVGARRAA